MQACRARRSTSDVFPWLFSIYFFETGSITGRGAHGLSQAGWPAGLEVCWCSMSPSSTGVTAYTARSSFYRGCGDLNSGLNACGTILTETSPSLTKTHVSAVGVKYLGASLPSVISSVHSLSIAFFFFFKPHRETNNTKLANMNIPPLPLSCILFLIFFPLPLKEDFSVFPKWAAAHN